MEFESAVQETKAERHARGFTCWGQFVAMLFCQMGQARTLREICGGLAASEGKLKHLGVSQAPNKSTLAYANAHRPWQLYQKVFEKLFSRCQQVAGPQRRFRFRNPLMTIDGTLIELCSSMYDWAKWQGAKGAAKLHLVLDHDGYLPRFAVITEGKASEVKVARAFHFEPFRAGHDCGFRPWVCRLPVVSATDRWGRLLRHAPAPRCALPSDRIAAAPQPPEYSQR